jgi:hypothetical protein
LSTLFLRIHLGNVQQPQGRRNHTLDPRATKPHRWKVYTPCCGICFFQTCLVSMSGVNMIMYKHTHRNMLQLLAQFIAQSVTTILCTLVYNSFLLSHHRWYEKEPPGLLLQRKITTKRVLRSASKPSSEPESSSDEDGMQEERRVSVNTSSTDIAFGQYLILLSIYII